MPALSFMVGIAVGSRWDNTVVWWLSVAVTLVFLAIVRQRASWASLSLLLAAAAVGGLRSSMVSQSHRQVTWPDGYVSYEGIIVSEVSERPKSMGMDVVIAGNVRKVKCYVAKDADSRRLKIGDRLLLTSRIERNRDWRQGTFDYRRYQEVHGFSGQTFVRSGDWQRQQPSWQGLPVGWRLRLHFLCYRHQLLERYRQMGAADDQYAVLAAMTLGDKSAMSSTLRQVYAVSGASHVLALSGLHLGIIYMLLSLLVVNRRLRLLSQVMIVTAIWAFALLVGLPASVVRAAVMISLYALLSLAGRNRMSVNALAVAALCILMVNPDSLADVGFQLSFLAMLAILLLLPLADRLVPATGLSAVALAVGTDHGFGGCSGGCGSIGGLLLRPFSHLVSADKHRRNSHDDAYSLSGSGCASATRRWLGAALDCRGTEYRADVHCCQSALCQYRRAAPLGFADGDGICHNCFRLFHSDKI